MNEFVTIKSFVSRPEAEVAASFLRANNIECQIFADDVGGMYPPPFSPKPGVELKIQSKDLDRASKLL